MSSADVVEPVNVLKEGLGYLIAGRPSVTPDQLGFQGFKEGLDGGIVVTVALTAHRHFEAKFA